MRKLMLALIMAVAAALGVMVPGAALAAPEYESEFAVKGWPENFGRLYCADPREKLRVCYEREGDKWWIQDLSGDSASAVVQWRNIRDGSVYRHGRCINSHGGGEWAYCNKNYYENSTLEGLLGYWDRDQEDKPTYYSGWWKFQ